MDTMIKEAPASMDFYDAADRHAYDFIYNTITKNDLYDSLNDLATMGRERRNRIRPKQCFVKYDTDKIAYAISVVDTRNAAPPSGFKPSTHDTGIARRWLADQMTRQTYIFTRDVTAALPNPNPSAPRLSVHDYDTAAKDIGIEAAAIHAVAEVEAGGRSGFDGNGRPKILFEGHWFRKFTGGEYDLKYPWLSKAYPKSSEYYKWDQYGRLYEAMDLDADAALKSASWGMFQVMGFNHNGWGSVFSFVDDMYVSEYMHLKSFASFCKDNQLIKLINDHNWAGFAKRYNGDGYAKNHYDTKMDAAYRKYAGK
jgi:hypothetical protein